MRNKSWIRLRRKRVLKKSNPFAYAAEDTPLGSANAFFYEGAPSLMASDSGIYRLVVDRNEAVGRLMHNDVLNRSFTADDRFGEFSIEGV